MPNEDSLTLHKPVLLDEVIEHFPTLDKPSILGLDGTFGRGGHTNALLKAYKNLKMLATDQDKQAIAYAEANYADYLSSGRLNLYHCNFVDLEEFIPEAQNKLQFKYLDFILLDLGVSSPQLDEAERGFSFYHEGPLDMRMDQDLDQTASDVLHTYSEDELIAVFRELGEVRSPYRVVRAIVHDRKEKEFNSTLDLAQMIERIEGWRKKGHHPATKYFMALRLEVNNELGVVKKSIPKLIDLLSDGGRLMILTFHSLEDRIVKYAFKEHLDKGRLVNKKVIIPSKDEQKVNSRSRSAKLRIFERTFDE